MSEKEGKTRQLLFWTSLLLNLGLLLYFKYMNFFIEQLDILFGYFGANPSHWVKIALPLGISFITFQKLAYTLDVYKKQFTPFKKPGQYAMYILMFPQLLSGPIVRPKQIASQIADRSGQESIDDRLTGFFRFAIGLAKKVLIADVLGEQVNAIFAMHSFQLSSGMAWIGAIAYTFQIYFDFSGYTDDDGIQAARELQQSLCFGKYHRILETLAYDFRQLVPRLCVPAPRLFHFTETAERKIPLDPCR
jgi:alginate O-acetyltransferase complex protein AlgI